MHYQPHTNPIEVHCHICGDEITLKAQYIQDSVILCEHCIEEDDEVDDNDTW